MADNLSTNHRGKNRSEKVEGQVRCISSHTSLDLYDESISDIKMHTRNYHVIMSQMLKLCQFECLDKDSLMKELIPFHTVQDELFVQNGMVLKGDRIVRPGNMRKYLTRFTKGIKD